MGKVVVILVVIGALGWFGIKRYPEYRLQKEMDATVRQANAQFPQVYSNALRMEHMEYANHLLHASGVILSSVNVDDSKKALLQAALKDTYCKGPWQPFAKAKVAIQLSLSFESVFYKGMEWSFTMQPQDCGAA